MDPLAVKRSWVTPYNYVQNNPILRIDPTGALDGIIYNANGVQIGDDGRGDDRVFIKNTTDNTQMSQAQARRKISVNEFSRALGLPRDLTNLTAETGITSDEFNEISATLYAEMDYINPNAEEAAAIYDVLENRTNSTSGQGMTVMEIIEGGGIYGYGNGSYDAAIAERDLGNGVGYSALKHQRARQGLILGLTSATDYSNGAYFWEGTSNLSNSSNYFNVVGHGTTQGSKSGIITFEHTRVVGGTTFMRYNQTLFPNRTWR